MMWVAAPGRALSYSKTIPSDSLLLPFVRIVSLSSLLSVSQYFALITVAPRSKNAFKKSIEQWYHKFYNIGLPLRYFGRWE